MKSFTPKRIAQGKTVRPVHLSSHLVRPGKVSAGKLSIKAPKIGSKRSVGKLKIGKTKV
jgi:hypothetical protein